MKKSVYINLLFSLFGVLISFSSIAEGYKIQFKINGLADTTVMLAYHFGDKQYVVDSTRANAKGEGFFQGKEPLPGGIYILAPSGFSYLEFIIASDKDQKFLIETEAKDPTNKAKISGSQENTLFNDYQKFMISRQKEMIQIRSMMSLPEDNPERIAAIKKSKDLEKEAMDYENGIEKKYPNALITKIFTSLREPDVSKAPKKSNGEIDSTLMFYYFKENYLNYVDLSDRRFLRTPILQQKINYYTDKLTLQIPDSIIAACDTIIERSRGDKEVFKYTVVSLTNKYEISKVMGFDAIFVHLAAKYYLNGDAYWADSTLKAKISERVSKLKFNQIGSPAVSIAMWDSLDQRIGLYSLKNKYVVLYFWDPTCSHCKVETPKLKAMYDSLRVYDVEVYAVGMETDPILWKQYIREHDLNWVNVHDIYNKTNFRFFYDIYSTPVVYLLDTDKKILAKRISVDTLSEMLREKLGLLSDSD
ncbi:MAG TPA: thioredoxin-like domain-containing protein [Bacteroidia bacterium]|nr:thioredoxin-like domain-containing protein [Bacteroidia bacterium]